MKENSRDIDSELIKKAKKGNHGAFNILMNKYYPRVYASIFSFIKSKEDSEDLSQQTFIKVWEQLDTFRGDSAFFTWVYRIAINLAKNFVTSSGFKKQKINTSIEDAEIDISSFDDIESIFPFSSNDTTRTSLLFSSVSSTLSILISLIPFRTVESFYLSSNFFLHNEKEVTVHSSLLLLLNHLIIDLLNFVSKHLISYAEVYFVQNFSCEQM